jgi:hypothetical protein
MPFGPEHSCNKGPVISGNAPALGHDYPTQDQVFNFKNSFISPLQNMKSRKTNKTSMLIFCIYFLIPYSEAQNQTGLVSKEEEKRTKKYGIENGLLNKKRGWCVYVRVWGVCVCVCEDLTNRF